MPHSTERTPAVAGAGWVGPSSLGHAARADAAATPTASQGKNDLDTRAILMSRLVGWTKLGQAVSDGRAVMVAARRLSCKPFA
jgi:hypothetical protein